MKQCRLKFCCTAVVQHPIKEQGVPEKKTRGELKNENVFKGGHYLTFYLWLSNLSMASWWIRGVLETSELLCLDCWPGENAFPSHNFDDQVIKS